jgi:octopine oxidase subunit A
VDSHYQLAIIGAGPAGLAAAITASGFGIKCAVFDEQPALGGQIYRSIESIPDTQAKLLGEEYSRGKKLVDAFRACNVDYFPSTQVWSLNRQREIGLLHDHQARMLTAEQVLVASGAMERPVPFPGWTLPGVMHAGAGQILFKSAAMVPAEGVVLAGSGPLLLLLAWQYLQAQVKVQALLDLTPLSHYLKALPKLPRALLARHYLTKGLSYQLDLWRAGIPNLQGVSALQAVGEESLQYVKFKHLGREKTIESGLLMTHFGVIPHVWLTQAAGCTHQWDASQQCWRPEHDEWGCSSIDGILVAGDGAGIGGARSAEHAGRIVALQMLFALGKIKRQERNHLARDDRKWMQKERHVRPFLEVLFHIPRKNMLPTDETIVCRCEEITAGQVRTAVANGHADSNQVKFLTRCGMGPCQGRQCANAVAQIIADTSGKTIEQSGLYRGRPPVAPLSLGQLAALSSEQEQ